MRKREIHLTFLIVITVFIQLKDRERESGTEREVQFSIYISEKQIYATKLK